MPADEMSVPKQLTTTDLKIAALAFALGHRIVGRSFSPTGLVELTFADVPRNLLDRLANDELQVSARRLLEALETVHSLVAQQRRQR